MKETQLARLHHQVKSFALFLLALIIMLQGDEGKKEDTASKGVEIASVRPFARSYADREKDEHQGQASKSEARDFATSDELARIKNLIEESYGQLVTNTDKATKNPSPRRDDAHLDLRETLAAWEDDTVRMSISLRPEQRYRPAQKITSQNLTEASFVQRLYEIGCEIMAGQTTAEPQQALWFFRKVIEVSPDPNLEYCRKARRRIAEIENR